MNTPGALEGVRVVELGHGIASAFAARLLGDLGADVIKVQELGRPDPVRRAPGRLTPDGQSALFEYLNWNKRAVSSSSPGDIDRLVATTAIVIAGGQRDAAPLRAANPAAVITLISNFGQTGPYAELHATDLVLQALSGVMAISGSREREPMRHGLRTAYYLAGLNGAYASLAGLLAAQRTGEGPTIDLAIRDCLSSELVMNHGYHVMTGVVQGRPSGAGDPFDGHPLPTGRGHLALQTSARQSTADMADLLGEPRLADLRFASAQARAGSGAELRAILAERLGSEPAHDVFLRASRRGLLSGAVQDAGDLLRCPQLAARDAFVELAARTPSGEPWRLPATLAALSRTPTAVRRRAPVRPSAVATVLHEAAPRPGGPPDPQRRDHTETGAAGVEAPVKPLAGVRVLDLSVIFAVPYMGALLADLGAEVIKIEAPRRIDQTRTDWGGYFDNDPGQEPWNRSATFQVVNRGKRSVALDLATPAGRELLLGLVACSDVVLDNFSPAVPPKLGLTYAQLSAVNPGLVMLSNTGYGSTGPWAAFKAQGTTLEATMGLMAVTGYEDGPPSRAGQSVPDFIACWAGLTALLAALVHRERTGEGQWIDLGMYQLGPAVIPEALIAAQAGEPAPPRGPAADLDALDSALVATRDGWLAVAVADEVRRAALHRLLGRESLAQWAAARDGWPAARELQATGIAAAPVLDAETLLADPQLIARGFFEAVDISQLGARRPLIGRPYIWQARRTKVGIASGAPSYGADNDTVLGELLGLDSARIARLRAEGVVVDRPLDPPPAAPMDLTGMRAARHTSPTRQGATAHMVRPRVHITEECMREGMQIESADISVEDKVRLLDALSATGLRHIVVGSFVSPRYTPQMTGIEDLLARFTPAPGVRYSALALNARGRERMAAWMPPLSETGEPPSTLCHMCDTFVRRNANISQDDEIASWPETVAAAAAAGARRAGIGVNAVFGSNFEGPVELGQAFALLEAQHHLWEQAGVPVDTVWLGDPMGWCTPDRVRELVAGVRDRWPAITHVYFHLHDARGLALACSYAAIDALDERFDLYLDSTAGGIGGCPYCGNGRATGLAATEDLVNLLEQMGIDTGVDLGRLIEAVWLLEEIIGRPAFGHVSKAGPPPSGADLYDPNLPVIETFAEARHFALGAQVTDAAKRPWRAPIPSPSSRESRRQEPVH